MRRELHGEYVELFLVMISKWQMLREKLIFTFVLQHKLRRYLGTIMLTYGEYYFEIIILLN